MVIVVGFSFAGNEALKHHHKTNSTWGKLDGEL